LIIRGCCIGRIVGRSGVTGPDKTDCERPHETVTAEEESSIIGKPTTEEELATDEAPAIEKWRAEWARMLKYNWGAEVAKPPHCSAAVKPANATSEPPESDTAEAPVKSAEPTVEATSASVEAPSTAKSCSPGRRERGGRQA
jgi:hypothetical protein